MPKKKLQIILSVILALLLCSTLAFAYTANDLGSRNLSYGMMGGDVRQLQTFLNSNGYQIGYADGIFGAKTRSGVVSLQKDRGLNPDGIVGPLTFTAMKVNNNSSNNYYTVQPGDSLYRIAARFGVTVDQLRQANGLKSDVLNTGQKLIIPGGTTKPPIPTKPPTPTNPPPTGTSLADILRAKGISGAIPDVNILVDKSSRLLTLRSGVTPLKTYKVAISETGLGDKSVAGDHKTPEGNFTIVERYPMAQDQYLGTRWMRLSYPNIEDAKRGLNAGIIDQETYQAIVDAAGNGTIPPQRTALGGGIGIHGGRDTNDPNKDWTWGCVALSKYDVEEMYDYTPIGTRVVIQQ